MIKAIKIRGARVHNLKNIDVDVPLNQIVGIAGVSGNGQPELSEAVTGLIKPDKGSIKLNGKEITSQDRRERIREGISFIPEDRNTTGACLPWSIEDNCIAGYHERFTGKLDMIDRKKSSEFAEGLIEKFRIKTPNGKLPISSLSGGNCQKVIVARETAFDPEVIVAAEPTRGVDIGAISTFPSAM